MIAYLLFLALCMVWYILCKLFNMDFEVWKRLVCAATFASFFFALASFKKTQANVLSTIKNSLYDSINSLNALIVKKENSQNNSIVTIDDLKSEIDNDKQVINDFIHQIEQANRASFAWNAVGFFMFFFISYFDFLYLFLVNGQDFLTLLAFTFILFIDVYGEYWIEKHNQIIKLNKLEDTQNGQT